MKHSMYYDDKDEVIYLEFVDDYLETDVDDIRPLLFELLEGKPYRQVVAILSMTNKVQNRATRQKSNQALIDAGVTEIAFVGGSAANRVIAKVLIKTGSIKINGDFFGSKEKALDWIKSKRK